MRDPDCIISRRSCFCDKGRSVFSFLALDCSLRFGPDRTEMPDFTCGPAGAGAKMPKNGTGPKARVVANPACVPSGALKLVMEVFEQAMCKKKQSADVMLAGALAHLQLAIELLDRAAAPGHIAANVDLAMNQLLDELGGPSGAARSIFSPGDEGCGTARPS
jgi:hypothetical protein